MPLIRSKYSWEQWFESVKSDRTPREMIDNKEPGHMRRVHNMKIGEKINITVGHSYQGSGGYEGSVYWQSPNTECPIHPIQNNEWDNGFASGISMGVCFTEPGVLSVYEYDCIGEHGRVFADDIFICIE